MATLHQPSRKSRRERAAPERAEELALHLTAQPHSPLSELGMMGGDEAGSSIDPEDLGSHYLSEATVQGDMTQRDVAELELTLQEDFEVVDEASSEAELAMWLKQVELAAQGGDVPASLREAAAIGLAGLEAEREIARTSDPSISLRVTDSSHHDASLLDREGDESDETVAPEVVSDDGGRHARSTPRDALGEQVSGNHS